MKIPSLALSLLALPHLLWAEPLCNGRAAYCDRPYSNTSFIGAHNSPFVGFMPQQNQDISVTGQLNLGIRYLQGQTHLNAWGKLHMCHTSCFLEDAGPLESFLHTVKVWLDSHPEDVVTLLITNGDRLDIGRFQQAFDASGIVPYAYVPMTSPETLARESWPTLEQLIRYGKRLVVFLDYHADVSRVPYILDQYAYYFETPFDTTDPDFQQCSIDRPPNANPDGRMYVVNHYLDLNILGILIPDRLSAPRTNSPTGDGSIGAQADLCKSIYRRTPDVVLLDFITQGDVFKAQDMLNGL
ncbi:hypothetical protein AJ80_04185 [Polytolypa hystricis UAMH7299]|uniref:Phosphatidylinositol-specific phospholipase C X domain-containing protein n=1 Tax=Polytolypa hystricis (strain UAMH7299) TaxID=1447883 RepID=A0A2B7Y4Z9_POLH7|nr:hypothetical protein AJ80_04185 [Polytolypa hystricis UAMH7299]